MQRHINLDGARPSPASLTAVQRLIRSWLGVLFVASIVAGCASDRQTSNPALQEESAAAATPPLFLTGPMSVLLTNASDFSARISVTNTSQATVFSTGNIFQQEGRILFVPMREDAIVQRDLAAHFRFLWDIGENRGYILSEALRAYVQMPGNGRLIVVPAVTSIVPVSSAERDGRPCHQEETKVTDNATSKLYSVCRDDATGVALEIKPHESEEGTVLLTQFNPERLAPDLFGIPPGFAAYASVDAMVREVLRKPRIMPYSNGSTSRRNRH